MKNSLDGLSNRFEQTVAIISKFECSFIEIMQSEEQRGKKEWRKTGIQRMWDTTNYTPLHIIWIPKERRKRKEGKKSIWRNNTWKLAKFIGKHYTSAKLNKLHRINAKRSTNRYSIVKMLKSKNKQRILKAARDKGLTTFKGTQ